MKINSCVYNTTFKGKFYATTDGHARTPMLAGVLTEIGKQAKTSNEPQFYIDGGDFLGQSIPLSAVSDVFIKFHEKNPNVQMIFNMGNVETESVLKGSKRAADVISKLAKNGINFVSLTMKDALKKKNMPNSEILPYMLLEDEHDGKKEKILITGIGEFSMKGNEGGVPLKSDVESMKKLLKDELLPVFVKEKPDKTIIMSHCMKKNTNELLDYANEIGIDNISLVIGGHPHSIEDYEYGQTRVLYPPAQGKGAYVVENTSDGIKFDKVPRGDNGYIYEPVLESSSVIANLDVNNPLPIAQDYQEILNGDECKDFQQKIATATISLKYRNDYDFRVSEPTQLGTFIANGYRDCTGADIGLSLSMDLRERAPKAGQDVTAYNICDVLNVEKNIFKYGGISADELKGMLEVAFKHQKDGIANRDFFEYSDNVKVERVVNADENEPKVKQIYIKENDEFIPLLDENGKQLNDKKYTVATCEYVAKGPSRESLAYFQKFPSEKVEGVSARGCFISQYKKFEQQGITEFNPSEIVNIYI
ncbi:5'-nucleotidase C-terminal domain-containing protein [bacterium]|nr:5'-nucleotidase C-terminal domain-containing protein [bacterium]